MSDKRRRKLEKRQKRQEKRERQHADRFVKAGFATCPNCGETYRSESKPDEIHRPGPCDCTPERRREMNDFLDKRAEQYEMAPDGKIKCPLCTRLHGEDQQCTLFVEGRLVWNGCDTCRAENESEVQAIFARERNRWTHAEEKRYQKYVAPFAVPRNESIRDSAPIYQGSIIRPQGR